MRADPIIDDRNLTKMETNDRDKRRRAIQVALGLCVPG